jgi:hypothetical protein
MTRRPAIVLAMVGLVGLALWWSVLGYGVLGYGDADPAAVLIAEPFPCGFHRWR